MLKEKTKNIILGFYIAIFSSLGLFLLIFTIFLSVILVMLLVSQTYRFTNYFVACDLTSIAEDNRTYHLIISPIDEATFLEANGVNVVEDQSIARTHDYRNISLSSVDENELDYQEYTFTNFEIDKVISHTELSYYCSLNNNSEAMITPGEYPYNEDESQIASIILDVNNSNYRVIRFKSY